MEFKKQKISKVTRVEGISGIPKDFKRYGKMGLNSEDITYPKKLAGRIGCLLSHLKIIKEARQLNLEKILILEDDVQFIDNVQEKFANIYRQIPKEWSLLYFGGNEKGKQIKIDENIMQISNMLMAHAIGINICAYDKLIKLITGLKFPVDVYYTMIQKQSPCYAMYPYLAWQRAGWSDIEQRFRIYDLENSSPSLLNILKSKA